MGGTIKDSNTRVNITLPKELKKQLTVMAKLDQRSFNNLVLKILSDYVEQHYCNDDESTEIPRLEELLT